MRLNKEALTAVAVTGGIIAIITFWSIGVSAKDAMDLQVLKTLLNANTVLLLLFSAAGSGLMLASLKSLPEKRVQYSSIVAVALATLSILIIPNKTEALVMGAFTAIGVIAFSAWPKKNSFVYLLAAGALITGILVVQSNPQEYQQKFKQQIGTIAGNVTNSMQNILTKDDVRNMVEEQKMSRQEIENLVLAGQGIKTKADLRAKMEEQYAETYGDLWNQMTDSQKQELVDNATENAWNSIQSAIDEQYNAQSDPKRIDQIVNSTYAAIQEKISNENSSIQGMINKVTEKLPFFKTLLDLLPFMYGFIAFTAVTIYGVLISPFYWLFQKLFSKKQMKKKEWNAKMPRKVSPEEQQQKTYEKKAASNEKQAEVVQEGKEYKPGPAAKHEKLKI